jgi:hypothetical protein
MSNRILLLLLSVLVLLSVLLAQTSKANRSAEASEMDRDLKATLLNREHRVFCESWKNGDTKMFEANSTQDFVAVDYTGADNKSELLKMIGSKACQVNACTVDDNSAQLINTAKGVAVMYYKVAQDATCDGQKVPPEVWAATVWVKRAGKWQAAFHQETPGNGAAPSTH